MPAADADAELDEEMVEIFLEEAVDILESAGQALERWLSEPDNTLPLSSLQRDLHTLKGGARMAAIRPIGDLGHELESLYEGLVDRRYSYSDGLGDLLHRSHDRLAQMLDQLQARQPLPAGDDLIQAIRQFRQGGVTELAVQPAAAPLQAEDEPVLTEIDAAPLESDIEASLADETLADEHVVAADESELPMQDVPDP